MSTPQLMLERDPDALRTVFRMLICFTPAAIFAIAKFADWHGKFSHYDPVHFHELLNFNHQLLAGFLLATSSIAMGMFATWQTAARNPLLDPGCMGWLAIHGWNGDLRQLPQRGLLPLTEVIGVLVISLICARFAATSIIVLPMIWSLIRLLAGNEHHCRHHPWAYGCIWLLQASAFLMAGSLWIAVPLVLTAILLTEALNSSAVRQKTLGLINDDVTLEPKSAPFSPSSGKLQQQRNRQKRIGRNLYPFQQLSPDITDSRVPWHLAIWSAAVLSWVIWCFTTRIELLCGSTDYYPDDVSPAKVINMVLLVMSVGCVFATGLIMRIIQYAPFVWLPRCNLWTRIRLLKPIIWSWDRVWIVLMPAALLTALPFTRDPSVISPTQISLLVFALVMLLLRSGPARDSWQMTADARLSTTFISQGNG